METPHQIMHSFPEGIGHAGHPQPGQFAGIQVRLGVRVREGQTEHTKSIPGHFLVLPQDARAGIRIQFAALPRVSHVPAAHCQHLRRAPLDRDEMPPLAVPMDGDHVRPAFGTVLGLEAGQFLLEVTDIQARIQGHLYQGVLRRRARQADAVR